MDLLEQNFNSDNFKSWFDRIASLLLNEISFSIAGENHRLAEIEFYYHNEKHPALQNLTCETNSN